MKRCPQCGRDYNDDSLSYCLDDGAELLYGPAVSVDEPRTAMLSAAATDEAATRAQIHTTEATAVLSSGVVEVPGTKGFDKRLIIATLALAVVYQGFHWSHDGNSLIYINTLGGISNLWRQPLRGGPSKQITDFKTDKIYSFAYSRDGKMLALARGSDSSDVVLITDAN